jgi:hypothetical protein
VGIFKRMKDMKDMVEAAPGMVQQARQLGAQAQEFAAAQQAAAQAQMNQMAQSRPVNTPGAGADQTPIAGVSIELYAEISKGLAAYGYDQSKAVELAAAKGIPADAWAEALAGWNQRIAADPSVAQRFNTLYRAG